MEILNDNKFDEYVLNSKGVVFVDFFATWCGPCRMLTPILEEVAKEVDVPIYKVDVDEAEKTAKMFGILSIPTMILFINGKETEKLVGLRSKDDIVELIQKYTNK